ncbi:WD repeat-containing protein 44 [Rhodamnia argentea]|uniref:WD repeat-containing protein 44-like n=1 Tax=Rhodamnia argentea TaxID=178133 RepID=A0A8B8PCI1_9MYRT|nr:WD repeat-containing protein 44 [Rhodamnia argentea]XP_030532378.1 WD repeat-containing protein 44 [Rhodamnia argentea]XP_030532379.1 WD repeat-containing protein 44 [Rhodamnia argentea]XP_030532380.1 WD repeat-containing protein 44 [Rhodamnia argentea]
MGSFGEEEDDQFFDAHEEISFVDNVHGDRFRGAEITGSGHFPGDSASTTFTYDVWMRSPCSVEERRTKFLNWMGVGSDSVACQSSADVGMDPPKDVDRVKGSSGAVLRNSGFKDELCSSRSSESSSSSDNSEWARELVMEEENFICRAGNGDGAKEGDVNDLGVKMSEGQDMGSNWLDRVKRTESRAGSSPLANQFEASEPAEANGAKEVMKKLRKRWLTKLRSMTCVMDRQVEVCSSKNDALEGMRVQRVKVRHCRKQLKELSALFMGQDFQAHSGIISKMKFSPDGWFLASASEDRLVKIWQVVEDDRSDDLDIPEIDPSCLYFTVNHVSELTPLYAEKEKMGKPRSLRKTSDSACVIFPPKVFRILEKPLHEFRGHKGEILDLSWSTDNYLLSSSVDNTVCLWQVGSDNCLGVFKHTSYVTSVQFNPVDNNYFISGSIDGKVRIWAVHDCQVVDWTDVREIVTAVSYRPDGQGMIVGCMSGSCRFYSLSDNHLQLEDDIFLCSKKKSLCKRITGFEFFPHDSSKLMVTSADSQIRILDGVNLISRYRGCRGAGNQNFASLTLDGKHIVSASEDSSVYIWNCLDQKGPVPSEAKVIRSCERFSSNASVAIPWCGFNYSNPPDGLKLDDLGRKSLEALLSSPACFSQGTEFFLESFPKGSATWPEEKLPTSSPWASSRAMYKTQCKFLRSSCQSTSSAHAWGLVIVTAGCDGRIRSFLNYGWPVPH